MDAFPGRAFKATVEAIDPLIDANARSIGVRAVLPNTAGLPAQPPAAKAGSVSGAGAAGGGGLAGAAPSRDGGPLRPGMFAKVSIVFAVRDNALTVPEEAIVPQGSSPYVFTVVPGTAVGSLVVQRVPVRLGQRQGGMVEVQDGLSLGDKVVTAGQQRVQRDGAPVRVVELPQAPVGGASSAQRKSD